LENGQEGYQELIHALLREIKKGEPCRKAYVHESLSFNYISTETVVYVAVCNEEFPTKNAFAFLQHVRDSCGSDFSQYEAELEKQMKIYSDPEKINTMEAIKKELSQVKDVMKENIEKILEREEVLKTLESKTELLDFNSGEFRGRASALHRNLWWKDKRIIIAGIIVLVVAIFLLVWICCGLSFQRCS